MKKQCSASRRFKIESFQNKENAREFRADPTVQNLARYNCPANRV